MSDMLDSMERTMEQLFYDELILTVHLLGEGPKLSSENCSLSLKTISYLPSNHTE
jgi:hypothetical protein